MATLDELNDQISEKERIQRKLWLEIQDKKKAVADIEQEWECVLEEIRDLEEQKKLLKIYEMNEAEKQYVDEQITRLEQLLNEPNVSAIDFSIAEPDYESKTLTIRIATDFEKEGLKHSVRVWSNRKGVLDRIRSCIHIPPHAKVFDDEDLGCAYHNDYYWTKAEKPDVQMFKRT